MDQHGKEETSANHVDTHSLKYQTKTIHWNRIKTSYKIQHEKGKIFIMINDIYNNMSHVKWANFHESIIIMKYL